MSQVPFDLFNSTNISLLVNNVEPFFGYILGAVKIKYEDTEEFPFAACTYNTILLNKKYVSYIQEDNIRLKGFVSVLLHELYHIFLRHHWRFGFGKTDLYFKYKDKSKYLKEFINIATDAVINTTLRNNGYKFDEKGFYLDNTLAKDSPLINRSAKGNVNEEEVLLELLSKSTITEEEYGASITFPSGESIKVTDVYIDVVLVDKDGIDKEINSKEDLDFVIKKGSESLKGKFAGKLSANLIIEDNIQTKPATVNWQDTLKNVVSNTLSNKLRTNYNEVLDHPFYSFVLGLNDFKDCPIEHPYLNLPDPNTIAVFIDLSGSIFCNKELINKFLSELNTISTYVDNLLVMTFDTEIKGAFLFEGDVNVGDLMAENKEKYLVGGGGTDVRPLFKEMENDFSNLNNITVSKEDIACVIVLTDLQLYDKVPIELEPNNSTGNIQTIWAVPESVYSQYNNQLFGINILIK